MDRFDPRSLQSPAAEALADVVRHVVQAAHPSRIILFGSAARGAMTRDSDFDLLVVVPGVTRRRDLVRRIRASFQSLDVPSDLVVVTPEELERYAERVGSIVMPALREGRELYAA